MPFEHHNYTRLQLQPALQPFKLALNELQNTFFSKSFTIENLPEIMQIAEQMIIPLINPIQIALDECIYLNKMKNSYPENTLLQFFLGISSAEHIINYFQ